MRSGISHARSKASAARSASKRATASWRNEGDAVLLRCQKQKPSSPLPFRARPCPCFAGLWAWPGGCRCEAHPDFRGESAGHPPQHAQGMAFVAGGFQPADLLLKGLEQFCQIFLGQPSPLSGVGFGARKDVLVFVTGRTAVIVTGKPSPCS